MTLVPADTRLDDAQLDLHGAVESFGVRLVHERERPVKAPEGTLAIGHDGEILVAPGHSPRGAEFRKRFRPSAGPVRGDAAGLPDHAGAGREAFGGLGIGVALLRVLLQLRGYQVARHAVSEVVREAVELGSCLGIELIGADRLRDGRTGRARLVLRDRASGGHRAPGATFVPRSGPWPSGGRAFRPAVSVPPPGRRGGAVTADVASRRAVPGPAAGRPGRRAVLTAPAGRPVRARVRPRRPATGGPVRRRIRSRTPVTGRPVRGRIRSRRPATGWPVRGRVRPRTPVTGRPVRRRIRPRTPVTGRATVTVTA